MHCQKSRLVTRFVTSHRLVSVSQAWLRAWELERNASAYTRSLVSALVTRLVSVTWNVMSSVTVTKSRAPRSQRDIRRDHARLKMRYTEIQSRSRARDYMRSQSREIPHAHTRSHRDRIEIASRWRALLHEPFVHAIVRVGPDAHCTRGGRVSPPSSSLWKMRGTTSHR